MNKERILAFPVDIDDGSGRVTSPGMSLRDYFAGQALNGITTHMGHINRNNKMIRAEMCYAMADAMLLERSK